MLPYINTPFEAIATTLGASVDEIKLISIFLFSYPLAVVLKRLPDGLTWSKNVFTIAVSLFYMIGIFDLWAGLRTIIISAGTTYAVSYYIDGSLMPWISFVFLMGHMSVNHIERQVLNDPSVVDVTGIQMVMIMKLSAFAWNVHDGRIKKQELLTSYQREKAIYEMPGFLDYTAYVLFFPALFAGPAFDYNDYKRWITTTMFDVKDGEVPARTRSGHKIPRSGTPATKKLVEGLFWIFLFLQLGGRYYPSFCLSDTFVRYSFLRRIWYVYALGFTSRLKYYGVWALTEGSCILTGLGYNGMSSTGKPLWDRLNNVYPWGLESAQNTRGYLENWNKNTNNWLRNYVYLRVTPRGQKPGFRATLATFMTSAFWHGFYPGYYLTFTLGAFAQTVAKHFRRHVRPFFLKPDGKTPTSSKLYYDIASWVVTQVGFSFVTLPFVVLGFSDSILIWARLYFYAIAGIGLSLAFFNGPGKKWLHARLEKRNGIEPGKLKRVTSERNMATLGLPDMDDIDDAVDEIRAEIDARKRRGSKVEFPSGEELKKAVSQRVWLKQRETKGPGGDLRVNLEQVQQKVSEVLNKNETRKNE